MLRELRAGQLGVIDELTLTFEPGLNVITGETGAGKSMVVGALGLLVGARADTDAVRAGAKEAEVEARLTPSAAARDRIEAMGLPGDDDLVIARRIRQSGSRAYINGRMVSAAQLRELADELVDIVGQHTAQTLLRPATQRAALDRFGGDEVAASSERVRNAFVRGGAIRAELGDLGGDPAALARESEILERQIDEIDRESLTVDELAALAEEIERLSNVESRREDAGAAFTALGAARDHLATAGQTITRLDDAAVANAQSVVDGLLAQADDALAEIREYVEGCHADPERLEDLQRRRSTIGDLLRRYGPDVADVGRFRDEADARLREIKAADSRVVDLLAELDEVDAEYRAGAALLSESRRALAPGFGTRISERLQELALLGASFGVELTSVDSPSRHGTDDVTFVFSGGSSQPLRRLAAVASGGELSRVMLALASEIADFDAAPTIVFDEIDSGTGGEGAAAVGRSLSTLAAQRQLLCVTHLAQVACCADHHITLRKGDEGVARAIELDAAGRVVELSRMLSGQPESTRAREHAAELVESAVAFKATRVDAALETTGDLDAPR